VKKIMWFVVTILVVLIAAIVVGPGFIDWNNYKSEISSQVLKATGRALSIDGDIQVTVLPEPAVIVNGVRLSNIEGGSAKDMVAVDRAEVQVALAPLLSGRVKIETIKLVSPVIELEQLRNGSNNWTFSGLSGNVSTTSATTSPSESDDVQSSNSVNNNAAAVAVDRFSIENGQVIYRDGTSGAVEKIDAINAEISAVSLLGPMESSGSLSLRGFPVSYQVNISEIIQNRTLQFNLNVAVAAGQGKMSLNGAVVGLDGKPEFQGQVAVSADAPSELMMAMTGGGLPDLLNRPFKTSAEVSARADAVNVSALSVVFGADKITGTLDVVPGDVLDVKAVLKAKKLNLDQWQKTDLKKTDVADPSVANTTKSIQKKPTPVNSGAAAAFQLPKNINASLQFFAEAASYNDGLVRNIIVNSELVAGEVTISQVSAEFPGGSDIALFGFLNSVNNKPAFEGELESNIGDLRGVLRWLDQDINAIPKDRLRKISLKTAIKFQQNQLQVQNLNLGFDGSKLTGAVTVALRKRPSFGANFQLDKINLEAYLPKNTARKANKTTTQKKPDISQPQTAINAGKSTGLLPSFLSAFDANIKARVNSVVYQGVRIKKINVDGTLFNNTLNLRNFSIADLGGAVVKTSGKINALTKNPMMDGVRVLMKTRNTAKLFKILKQDPPISPKRIGAVAVDMRLDGGLLAPKAKGSMTAAGATVDVNGQMNVLDAAKMIDAVVRVRHKKPIRLLKILGSTYRPKGPIGAMDVKSKIQGGLSQLNFTNLNAKLGKLTVAGDAKVELSGVRPKITAALNSNGISLDAFMPARKTAGLERSGPWKIKPASWKIPSTGSPFTQLLKRVAANISPRWSKQPIDLSALTSVDADIQFKSPLLTYGSYLLEKPNAALVLDRGVLNLTKFTTNIFGGQMAVAGTVGGDNNAFNMAAELKGGNVARITEAMTGTRAADGVAAFTIKLQGQARSMADAVSSANGDGQFAVNGVDVQSAAKGSPLAGLFDLILSLNQLGDGKNGKADAMGSFNVVNGVARTADFKLTSKVANGSAKGFVDLPSWQMDVTGTVKVAPGLLTTLMASRVTGVLDEIPFSIKGAIDDPDVNIKTGNVAGGIGSAAGGVIKKAPKPLQGLLQGILGGGNQQPQPQTQEPSSSEPSPQPQQQPQQQQKINPVDIFKSIFN